MLKQTLKVALAYQKDIKGNSASICVGEILS
jgi:hypothetical protein